MDDLLDPSYIPRITPDFGLARFRGTRASECYGGK